MEEDTRKKQTGILVETEKMHNQLIIKVSTGLMHVVYIFSHIHTQKRVEEKYRHG